jgi:Zn-dependent protease
MAKQNNRGRNLLSRFLESLRGNSAESNELNQLIIAVVVTTLIFAYDWQNPASTLGAIPLSFLAVVTAFLFHELAHRFVARRLNCAAAYRLWMPGLIFGLLMMFVGIKIILVGAVVISTYKFGRWGMKSRRSDMSEIGLIASSGPFTNLVFALIFEILSGSVLSGSTMLVSTLSYLAAINAWVALFNLVPIEPLDGGKVFYWNQVAWLFLLIFSLFLLAPSNIFGQLLNLP